MPLGRQYGTLSLPLTSRGICTIAGAKSVEDSLCKICNVVQSVDHVLLHCNGSNLTTNKTMFENKFCKYVPNYHGLSDDDKLQIVLSFQPLWKKVNENEACM